MVSVCASYPEGRGRAGNFRWACTCYVFRGAGCRFLPETGARHIIFFPPCHEGGGSEHSYFDEVESRRNSSTSSRSKVPKVNTSNSSRSNSNSSSR